MPVGEVTAAPRAMSVLVLGERGCLPQLALLGVTLHEDRIEARAYINYAALPRPRSLTRMGHAPSGWAVLRGGLRARVPKLAQGISLHQGLTLPITRKGR